MSDDNKGKEGKAEATENPAVNPNAEKEKEKAKADPKKPQETSDIVAQTKAILAKKPKVNFIIPLGEFEKPGAYDTVQINGYRLVIKKGVMVEIPLPVAELLANKYKIQLEAGNEAKIDRSADVQDALTQ